MTGGKDTLSLGVVFQPVHDSLCILASADGGTVDDALRPEFPVEDLDPIQIQAATIDLYSLSGSETPLQQIDPFVSR